MSTDFRSGTEGFKGFTGDDESLCEKRLLDLADLCYQRNYPTFSRFLSEAEQAVAMRLMPQFVGVRFSLNGGYEMAERKVACFYPKGDLYDTHTETPFSVLRISPKHEKYAEALTHRDVLGALMSLQIERACIGDIILPEVPQRDVYVFVLEHVADFVQENLCSIRRTTVVIDVLDGKAAASFSYEPKLQMQRGSVASLRLDCMVALAYRLSRSNVSALISGKKVYVNGRNILQPDWVLQEGDLISVRGFGRFRFDEVCGTSKKKHDIVQISLY